jgi:hypothetical protein
MWPIKLQQQFFLFSERYAEKIRNIAQKVNCYKLLGSTSLHAHTHTTTNIHEEDAVATGVS